MVRVRVRARFRVRVRVRVRVRAHDQVHRAPQGVGDRAQGELVAPGLGAAHV